MEEEKGNKSLSALSFCIISRAAKKNNSDAHVCQWHTVHARYDWKYIFVFMLTISSLEEHFVAFEMELLGT